MERRKGVGGLWMGLALTLSLCVSACADEAGGGDDGGTAGGDVEGMSDAGMGAGADVDQGDEDGGGVADVEGDGGDGEPDPVALSTAEVYAAMKPSCLPCHEAGMEDPYFESLERFEALIVADDEHIMPGDPEGSGLVVLLEGRGEGLFAQMPPDGLSFAAMAQAGETGLTMAQVRQWVANLPPREVVVVDCDEINPGPAPMRRLTAQEYENVVRDLLGIEISIADSFPPEDETLGFNNNAEVLGVTQLQAEKYFEAAELAAAEAMVDPLRLGDHIGLGCRSLEPECIEEFAQLLASRAYRRPLESGEAQRISTLYEIGAAQRGDFRDGLSLIIAGVLQSPHFLYRVEFGERPLGDEVVVPLTPYEMASRLSFFLWGSMPDQALFEAASQDALRTPAQIEAQARRMLDDPRAVASVANFHRQWLRTKGLTDQSKSGALYPEWDARLAADLLSAQDAFVEHVIWGEGGLEELYTAPYTFMNGRMADFYGVEGVVGDEFVKVELDPARHAGIVTMASAMATNAHANQSSPIKRGVFVREQLLCQILPQPPDNVDNSPPDVAPDATTRERFAAHTAVESCRACHELIDPIGFGFENYDAVGRFREFEGRDLIDVTGTVVSTDDMDGDFEGAVELAHSLAQSEQVQRCFVTQWFRFGHGRSEKDVDSCSIDDVFEDFKASQFDVREMLIAMTQTDAFMYRPIVEGSP